MDYLVKIWDNQEGFVLKKEILYQADNDVNAMQKASAATPDGCRSTYETIDKEKYEKEKRERAEEEVAA
jgi:cytochrome c556|tara:strand:- start:410 stop:616 length:207 start_codon:yes stop_codon:yes gene_type:complete